MQFFIEKVHEDKRGEMYHLVIDGKDYYLSDTKKGFGRGGEIHDIAQYNVCLKGKFMVRIISNLVPDFPAQETHYLTKGRCKTVDAGDPHVFIAEEDSVLLEWHDGKLPPIGEKKYFEQYRKLIYGKEKKK